MISTIPISELANSVYVMVLFVMLAMDGDPRERYYLEVKLM